MAVCASVMALSFSLSRLMCSLAHACMGTQHAMWVALSLTQPSSAHAHTRHTRTGTKIFVSNLPYSMDWADLKRVFRQAGTGVCSGLLARWCYCEAAMRLYVCVHTLMSLLSAHCLTLTPCASCPCSAVRGCDERQGEGDLKGTAVCACACDQLCGSPEACLT